MKRLLFVLLVFVSTVAFAKKTSTVGNFSLLNKEIVWTHVYNQDVNVNDYQNYLSLSPYIQGPFVHDDSIDASMAYKPDMNLFKIKKNFSPLIMLSYYAKVKIVFRKGQYQVTLSDFNNGAGPCYKELDRELTKDHSQFDADRSTLKVVSVIDKDLEFIFRYK